MVLTPHAPKPSALRRSLARAWICTSRESPPFQQQPSWMWRIVTVRAIVHVAPLKPFQLASLACYSTENCSKVGHFPFRAASQPSAEAVPSLPQRLPRRWSRLLQRAGCRSATRARFPFEVGRNCTRAVSLLLGSRAASSSFPSG